MSGSLSLNLPALTNMPDTNSTSVRAPLIIVSGPSGSGKSTLIHRVLERSSWPLRLSVSATTRNMRTGERAGIDYYYLSREEFERKLREDAFLEHALVHDNYYGTLQSEVEPYLQKGTGVILDIDVQGAHQVRNRYPEHCSIFIRASSLDVYEQRLRSRGTEAEPAIERRVRNARQELLAAPKYDYQVVNDDLAAALTQIEAIVELAFKGESNAR